MCTDGSEGQLRGKFNGSMRSSERVGERCVMDEKGVWRGGWGGGGVSPGSYLLSGVGVVGCASRRGGSRSIRNTICGHNRVCG